MLAIIAVVHLKELGNFEQPQLLQRTSEQIFRCFANLVLSSGGGSGSQDQIFFLKHFINDDLAQIEWRMDFFDKLFGYVLPQLRDQFQGINMKTEYFLHGWMMAMFCNVQGLEGIEFIFRIWDLYLLHGEPIIYCVTLAILGSKLHKLNNAPMQNWHDFFYRIKKIKIPQQCVYYQINHFSQQLQDQNPNMQSPAAHRLGSGRGESGSAGHGNFSAYNQSNCDENEQLQHHYQGEHTSNRGVDAHDSLHGDSLFHYQDDIITNNDSIMLIPLIKETMRIYVEFDVPRLFRQHQLQQSIAEQKHEIFSKMYLLHDDGGLY